MVTGIVIPADANEPVREIDTAVPDAIATAVGGLMEAVDLHGLRVTVYVNESGLLQHLPFNSRASFLWWYHVPSARQRAMLVGDAVIVGLPDDNGADTEVSTTARELLLSPRRFRVEVRTADDPTWHRNRATYPNYWEAIVWAMVLLERMAEVVDTRVVPVDGDAVEAA
ncbi:DUF3846 domain-containing protein [Leifsonia sp. H3M29-4]|uniref:DUF3846 domain-containing protein n=1 Tax=Salinibacterium metalliresistens TaxID=3031321 RepID=UPI0023DCD62C|nr:DUF3846 domain-containing protein [Salinibacterium metalliresistens]MDF1478794.1 DUF3846 domain-containing protein [Salinibacterium metalliresistens]